MTTTTLSRRPDRARRSTFMNHAGRGPPRVIQPGLAGGTKVIVSDLSPAIDGMLLNPVEDESIRARLDWLATPHDALTMGASDQ